MAEPLVSVCVITYNASKSITETLTSIKNQTYRNIELIISDDCSPDDTVIQCQKWIEAHKSRFVRTEIITVTQNTGIAANANRACSHAHGEWIKFIGDDILCECAVDQYLSFISENPQAQIVFAKAKLFYPNNPHKAKDEIWPNNKQLTFYTLSAREQFESLLSENCVAAPTSFFHKDILSKYTFDERFKFVEDYPMWLKLTHNNIKLFLLNEVTVYYRITTSSLSINSKAFVSEQFLDSKMLHFFMEKKNYIQQYAPAILKKEWKKLLILEIAVLVFNNRRNIFSRIGLKIIKIILNL